MSNNTEQYPSKRITREQTKADFKHAKIHYKPERKDMFYYRSPIKSCAGKSQILPYISR